MAKDKKQLKNLQLSDWATLIEDINYNFSAIISSPLFVGTEGEEGQSGKSGSTGIRGSRWFYINLVKFKEEFPEDNIIGEYQINEDYLNNKLIKLDTRKKLLNCFEVDMFVTGDIIICNSKILMVDLLQERSIIDTNNIINSSNDIVYENLMNQVDKRINEKINEINENIQLSFYTIYETHAKNYTDSSGYVNNEYLNSSIYDILVEDSKIGVKIVENKIIAPNEALYNETMSMTHLFGSANDYHKLIQRTLDWDESQSNNTTSEHGPSKKSNPALVVLQNDLNNGVMVGFKDADNLTSFGKIFVSQQQEKYFLSLLSPNVSNHYQSYSRINLFDNKIDIISQVINLKGEVIANNNFTMLSKTIFTHELFKLEKDSIQIGSQSLKSKTTFLSKTHYFNDESYLNADILSIDENSKLVASKYFVDDASLLKNMSKQLNAIPTNQLISQLNTQHENYVITNDTNITNLNTKIETEAKNRVSDIKSVNNQISDIRGTSELSLSELEYNLKKYVDDSISTLSIEFNTTFNNFRNETNKSISQLNNSINNLNDSFTNSLNALATNTTNEFNNVYSAINNIRGGYDGSMQTLNIKIDSNFKTNSQNISNLRGGYNDSMQSLNNKIESYGLPGTIIDLYIKSDKTAKQVIDDLFDASGRGKINVSYSTPVGNVQNKNISNLYICDGRSAPDLQSYITMMVDGSTANKIGDKVGNNEIKLTDKHIPTLLCTVGNPVQEFEIPAHRHNIDFNIYGGYHFHVYIGASNNGSFVQKIDNYLSTEYFPNPWEPVWNRNQNASGRGTGKSNLFKTSLEAGTTIPMGSTAVGNGHSHNVAGKTKYNDVATKFNKIFNLDIKYINNNQSTIETIQKSVYVLKCMIGTGL